MLFRFNQYFLYGHGQKWENGTWLECHNGHKIRLSPIQVLAKRYPRKLAEAIFFSWMPLTVPNFLWLWKFCTKYSGLSIYIVTDHQWGKTVNVLIHGRLGDSCVCAFPHRLEASAICERLMCESSPTCAGTHKHSYPRVFHELTH